MSTEPGLNTLITILIVMAISLLWGFITYILYIGIEYTIPVSSSVRLNTSVICASFVVIACIAIMYRKELWDHLRSITPEMDDEEE